MPPVPKPVLTFPTTEQQVKGALRFAAAIAATQLRGPSAAISLPLAIHTIGAIK